MNDEQARDLITHAEKILNGTLKALQPAGEIVEIFVDEKDVTPFQVHLQSI